MDPMDKARIVELANAVGDSGLLNGTTTPVQRLVDTHDVVWGVWQDAAEPHGVDMLLIKGQRTLMAGVAANKPVLVTITAIPCTCVEEAVALQEELGEPRAMN